MGKIKKYFFCLIFCILFQELSFAEVLTLRSGQKVEGKIIEQTDKYVKLNFQGTEVIYFSDEIASVDQQSALGHANIVMTPEMESLYKAYAAGLKVNNKPKVKIEEATVPVEQESVLVDQSIPVSKDTSIDQALSESQKPATMPDLSKLPPKYQEMVKSALSNLRNTKINLQDKKE
ncbi:MAG: hypothetical protein WCY09_01910 [Candidatus Omnitrophota bacterium]